MTQELKLKTVTRTQGNNQALKDGSVRPKTFEFDFEEVDPIIAAFRRMVRGNEFDICEMAITTYVCARAHGKRFTAVPVFLVRAFHHGATLHNTKAGIRSPKDLEGRRVARHGNLALHPDGPVAHRQPEQHVVIPGRLRHRVPERVVRTPRLFLSAVGAGIYEGEAQAAPRRNRARASGDRRPARTASGPGSARHSRR